MFKGLSAAFLAALASVSLAAQPNVSGPQKFTAFAVDVSNMTPRARTTPVDITINRWSSDADRDRLLDILRTQGQDAMLSAVQKLPVVGYFTTPGSLRYDLHFARQRDEAEGGRTIFLLTDRYVGSWEASRRPRTMDYPFTFIKLEVDKDGLGKGDATIYTKITATPSGTIELENYTNRPVMLNEVEGVMYGEARGARREVPQYDRPVHPLVIGVAGGSGSGKTTVVRKILAVLGDARVTVLEDDRYYRDRNDLRLEERA